MNRQSKITGNKIFSRRSVIFLLLILTTSLEAQHKLWIKPKGSYTSLFKQIKEGKRTKIFHIGDSHLNRGFTSRPIEQALHNRYGQHISLSYYAINGSTYTHWSSEVNLERIVEESPDLLIISLGTNDSYTPRFSAETLRASMALFITKLRLKLPKLKLVLTTPPACYLRNVSTAITGYKRSKGKRIPIRKKEISYSYNRHTHTARNTIKYFAQTEGLAVIDLYACIGTKEQAEEWLRFAWMHEDHIHYTVEGYTKQGMLIAQALIEAIEDK